MTRYALIVAAAALLVIACMGILKTVPVESDKKLQTYTVSEKAEKQQDNLRTTPLHAAIKNNKAVDVARLLIDGVDVNARDESGKAAIHYAAENGNTGIAKLLLSRNADFNIRSVEDLTPLHCATGYGRMEMVKFLLNYGADINAVSSKTGHTALFTARYKGYTNIARLLRAKGAVIDSVHTAVILGEFMETQKMLQKDISLARSVDKTDATPLHFAAYGGYKDIADLLLACGADINAKDALGRTPLHTAASKQKTETAVFLALKGANVDSQDNKKRTPLLEAVSAGNVDLAAQLLACGANPNGKNDNGWTPLHTAASAGYNKVVDLLLTRGADANIRQKDGHTPLHQAVAGNRKDTIKLLLARGANPDIKDNKGNTPLIAAASLRRTDLIKLLLACGSKVETVHDAAFVGDIKRLHQLLKTDRSLANAKNKSGLTPIFYACRSGNINAVILLTASGANVNAKSPDHLTPLCEAGRYKHKQVIKYLVSKGAKPDTHEAAPVKVAKTADHKQVAALMRVYARFTHTPTFPCF